jgi:hypothetical protein
LKVDESALVTQYLIAVSLTWSVEARFLKEMRMLITAGDCCETLVATTLHLDLHGSHRTNGKYSLSFLCHQTSTCRSVKGGKLISSPHLWKIVVYSILARLFEGLKDPSTMPLSPSSHY